MRITGLCTPSIDVTNVGGRGSLHRCAQCSEVQDEGGAGRGSAHRRPASVTASSVAHTPTSIAAICRGQIYPDETPRAYTQTYTRLTADNRWHVNGPIVTRGFRLMARSMYTKASTKHSQADRKSTSRLSMYSVMLTLRTIWGLPVDMGRGSRTNSEGGWWVQQLLQERSCSSKPQSSRYCVTTRSPPRPLSHALVRTRGGLVCLGGDTSETRSTVVFDGGALRFHVATRYNSIRHNGSASTIGLSGQAQHPGECRNLAGERPSCVTKLSDQRVCRTQLADEQTTTSERANAFA